jgi:hypothetical protein
MAQQTRRLLGGAVIASLLAVVPVAAQNPKEVPREGNPITFGEGIRTPDRLQPTPQYAALAPGLYARTVVRAASTHGDYTVEVWSLLVAPHASTGEARLPGAAVLSLRAGRVEVTAGELKVRLDAGATASIPEGVALRFLNLDDNRPAHLRAVVLSGKR